MEFLKKIWKLEKERNFWYQKALNYFEIEEYGKAKDAIVKDIEIHKENYENLFLLGKVHYNLKNYEESLEYYHKALEQHGKHQLRNTVKIDQMKNVRKFEEAVKYSDMVYQTVEIGHEYWYCKGLVLFNLGKFDKASSCFEAGLEVSQDNPKILYELSKSELRAGNKQRSCEILEKACTVDPQIKEKLRDDKDFE